MFQNKTYIYPTQTDAPLCEREKLEIKAALRDLSNAVGSLVNAADRRELYDMAISCADSGLRDTHAISHALLSMRTAALFARMIDPDRNILLAIVLSAPFETGSVSADHIRRRWGDDVAWLVESYAKVSKFASRSTSVSQDNFRGLLISLAEDIRVIIIMIAESLALMRLINRHPDEDWVRTVSFEANCLYAQLAHRLGLYKIKGELEDLSLKYTNRQIYTSIAERLNETKRNAMPILHHS